MMNIISYLFSKQIFYYNQHQYFIGEKENSFGINNITYRDSGPRLWLKNGVGVLDYILLLARAVLQRATFQMVAGNFF